jgi:hypothetical protein
MTLTPEMAAREDKRRLDWLEMQVVRVDTQLRWGSRENFISTPKDGDGYIDPSDLRAQIDAAMKKEPTDG